MNWLLKCPIVSFYLLGAIALIASPASAQSTPVIPAQQTLKTTTELVKLNVAVLDDSGNFVDGLKQQDFHVFDNGTESPISYFAPVTDPAKVVVVLETGPSVFLIKNEHIAAAYALLQGLAADDQVALITYSDVPREVVPFTSDKMQLLDALGSVQYIMGSAALNLYATVSNLIGNLARYPGKKAVVLLTTGLDSSPASEWTALTQQLRGSDVVIFSVGLLGPIRAATANNQKKSKKISGASAFASGDLQLDPTLAKAHKGLVDISDMTGGQAYFPQSGQEFAPAYRQIAACVRNEYVIGVTPEHDGQFHKLSVTVAAPNSDIVGEKKHKKKKKKKKHSGADYRVYFRQGYIAPAR